MNSMLVERVVEYDENMKEKARYNGLLIYSTSSLIRDYTGNAVATDGIFVSTREPKVGSYISIGKNLYRIIRVNTFMKMGRVHHYESEVVYAGSAPGR